MKDFMSPNKRLVVCIVLTILAMAGISVLAWHLSSYLTGNGDSRLAQIMRVETELLKQWQQSKGLEQTLAYNSTGNDVSLLQKMLSEDRNIYPEQQVTGYYGDLTRGAVVRFQDEYNMDKTGLVDEVTKNKLNEVFLQFLCPEPTAIYPDLYNRKILKTQKLPRDYVPSSLVNITDEIKTIGITCVSREVVKPLKRMIRDAERDGVFLAVTSGYRKPDIQKHLYDFWLQIDGQDALDEIAEPGASEHQLGTTVDFTDASIRNAAVDDRFGESFGGKWLSKNAHRYGFVMSYPKDKKDITGYEYEPWHWRFVGEDLAETLHSKDITFNELSFDDQIEPYPKTNIRTGLDVSAGALYSVFVNEDGRQYPLLEKSADQRFPMGDLSKLMVALTASDVFRQNDLVVIKESVDRNALNENPIKDAFFFEDALHALLIGLRDDVANSIMEETGKGKFMEKMNKRAKELEMTDTYFSTVAGHNGFNTISQEVNHSSASDLAKLMGYIFENEEDVFSVLEKENYRFAGALSGQDVYLERTNDLVEYDSDVSVVGGLVWSTSRDKMNLAIIADAPEDGYIVSVILASERPNQDARRLLRYVEESFVW